MTFHSQAFIIPTFWGLDTNYWEVSTIYTWYENGMKLKMLKTDDFELFMAKDL